jgi:hypothetical protein
MPPFFSQSFEEERKILPQKRFSASDGDMSAESLLACGITAVSCEGFELFQDPH